MFLMETKNNDDFIKMKLQSLNFVHYFSVPPVGLSGGLSLFWNDDSDITILESSPNLVDTKITHKGVTSFVSFVYGTPAAENRASFWNRLTTVGHGRDSPWLITGDFNDFLNNAEKVGGPARPEGSFTALNVFPAKLKTSNSTRFSRPVDPKKDKCVMMIKSLAKENESKTSKITIPRKDTIQ